MNKLHEHSAWNVRVAKGVEAEYTRTSSHIVFSFPFSYFALWKWTILIISYTCFLTQMENQMGTSLIPGVSPHTFIYFITISNICIKIQLLSCRDMYKHWISDIMQCVHVFLNTVSLLVPNRQALKFLMVRGKISSSVPASLGATTLQGLYPMTIAAFYRDYMLEMSRYDIFQCE
jgi:hypothetical protein